MSLLELQCPKEVSGYRMASGHLIGALQGVIHIRCLDDSATAQ
jgi:hypothetical protein